MLARAAAALIGALALAGCEKHTLTEPRAGDATLSGTVVFASPDGTRSPASGVRVLAVQCDVGQLQPGTMGGCSQHLQDSATTAVDGTYTLGKLFAGSAEISTANAPGYRAFAQNVGLPGGSSRLDIVLVPSG